MSLALNILLRASILFFTLDSFINAGDDRYAGKGLSTRNLIIVLVFAMVFPALYFIWKKWKAYPTGFDNLYLSIFWLDMFGNFVDVYNTVNVWDTLPHFHGPGALALILRALAKRTALESTGTSNMLHAGLEVQEYVGDLLFGTQNVQGAGDTAHDIACGLIGSWAYVGGYALYRRWKGDREEAKDHDREPEGEPVAA
jgi:hypothetical protein